VDDLFKTFAYLSNKNNEENKENTLRVWGIFFNKTDHNSYFTKLNFGRLKIKNIENEQYSTYNSRLEYNNTK
jgi:hypothetical protein